MVVQMPRKKKTIVEETLPDNPPAGDEGFVDQICVVSKVYKINSGGRAFCYQSQEPVDEVSIQAQYPSGGKFVVIEYNGLNDVLRTTHIEIEPKPLAITNGNNGDDFRTRMLMDELNFTRNMMLKMIENMSNGKGGQSATPFGELVEGMRLMHEMSPATSPADLILKGLELGMKAGGNGGAGDWKAELISAAKDTLPAVVQAVSANRQQLQQGQTTMIAPTPAAMIKQGIDWLKPQILGGMSTDLAVGWVIQNSREPMCNQLIAMAIQGDVNTFIQHDAELAKEPYRTWFETAIQLLKDEYAQQQGGNPDDSERGIGDNPDAANDANIGAGKSTVLKVS